MHPVLTYTRLSRALGSTARLMLYSKNDMLKMRFLRSHQTNLFAKFKQASTIIWNSAVMLQLPSRFAHSEITKAHLSRAAKSGVPNDSWKPYFFRNFCCARSYDPGCQLPGSSTFTNQQRILKMFWLQMFGHQLLVMKLHGVRLMPVHLNPVIPTISALTLPNAGGL